MTRHNLTRSQRPDTALLDKRLLDAPSIERPIWTPQEDSHGCGAACFAMLTNRTYAGAKAIIRHDGWTGAGASGGGVTVHTLDQFLAEDGIAVARKYRYLDGEERSEWPVEPFAEAHLCLVSTAAGGHFVVMLRDGTVLDPADPRPRRLTDYLDVMSVAGVTLLEDDRS